MDNRKTLFGEFLLLILAMIWGGTFVAGKFALETMPNFFILAVRFNIAGIILAIIFRKELTKTKIDDIKSGFIVGLTMFIGIAIQMQGLKYTSASNQTFILVTYVIIVPLLNWIIRGERPKRKILISAFIMIIGVGLVSLNKELTLNFGDILTLIYALFFSLQLIFVSIFVEKVNPFSFTVSQMFVAGLLSLLAMAIFDLPLKSLNFSKASLFGLFYLTILNTAVAFLIQNIAQKHARPSKAALIMATETVFGAIAAYIFAGEVFTNQKILGCILIVVAILITKVNFKRKNSIL